MVQMICELIPLTSSPGSYAFTPSCRAFSMLMVPQILSSVAPSGSSTCAAGHDSPLLPHGACCTRPQSQASGAHRSPMTGSSPDYCPTFDLNDLLDCQGRLRSNCEYEVAES